MRESLESYYMRMALVVASRSTCARRQVGAIITDRGGFILSTGYNGVASGEKHCMDSPCPAASSPSGQDLDGCYALHAEMNAVARLRQPERAHVLYVTVSPCMTCMKLLAATEVRRIVYLSEYTRPAVNWWIDLNRTAVQLNADFML